MRIYRFALAGTFVVLSGCGGDTPSNDAQAAPVSEAANKTASTPALASCPFRSTENWRGSIEGGRLLVTGQVDLMMAGFKPELSPRGGSTLAFDLKLTPDPTAAVNNLARYERTGSPVYRQGEIWCGDKRIATFDIVHIQ